MGDISDQLVSAASKAFDLIERLQNENETMKAASCGVLPDGTPVEDMLQELKELKTELSTLRSNMRHIHSTAIGAKSATAYADIKHIIKLSTRSL